MRLSSLLSALPPEHAPRRIAAGSPGCDPSIRGLSYDSRSTAAGDAFFALRGAHADGHDYLAQALERGAAAVFVEAIPGGVDLRDVPAIVVDDTRRALAPAAAHFFGMPSRELCLIGVTGTNGKTSTTYLVESILAAAGRRVGLIGTIEVRYAESRHPSLNTTPESLDLQRTLRAMRSARVDAVAMEVSSHGLELGRVDGCLFSVGAFTNLTQDHLDFHGDMDAYRASKALLFQRYLAEGGAAVLNRDDAASPFFAAAARSAGARIVGVTRRADAEAEVRLLEAEVGLEGSRVRMRLPAGELCATLPLVGDFNVENALVACGIAVAAEIPLDAITKGIAQCPQVPGRVQRVGADLDGAPTVIVDYAHTPDAVDKLLATLRPLCRGRLLAVFGCGGDRDRAKRPLMAQAVARHADRAVATSDNPRTEDPERILDDVAPGLHGLRRVEPAALDTAERSWCRLTDRRAAIACAIGIARREDTVVLAGKGHEDYQIIGREKLPFSDADEALRALRGRRATTAASPGVEA
ncbi:MAG TPA: UDP-N-acetylmuramoyl-L-alanyl-D-glutamate--2,6-diaminopimelate ligase [Myxococcota bacterium]